jgi:glycosyltransferase involved in cell wall biosynthesis
VRVAFVYPNPRGRLLEDVAAGRAPDTNLLGENHLAALGIDAAVHESAVRRRERASGLVHRVTWNARELTLPWEVGDADVIVTPIANVLPLVARARRRLRVVVVSYHLCALHERLGAVRRRLLGASVRSAAAVVTIADAARTRLLEQTGADPARVHVARLGVDERWWTALPPAPGGHILAVGRDLARDYSTLAQAVAPLSRRTVIVAKEENLRGLRLPGNVEVRLNVPPAEVRELYAGAACVVLPIRHEGYAWGTENSGTISLLEAMACARPIVVTERSYLADYVRPGVTALTAPAEDAEALRARIAEVIGGPDRAASLGAAARDDVEMRFRSRHFAERLAAVLRGLPSS